MNLPPLPGSYALIVHLPTPLLSVDVGRLGAFDFAPGTWIYCGSARGPGGLRARIRRHVRPQKRIHWHVDTLTIRNQPVAILYTTDGAPKVSLECRWTQSLLQSGMTAPVRGFGSSDCTSGCPAHLLHSHDFVSPSLLSTMLHQSGFTLAIA